ncbi:GntR family transcriptional regulator [Marinobacter alexandrii]|jgi:DNA-binding GntR family transcriptional regulator|uniref:GntR family transcriptional regulator n=1 Tax=Marinobacter alexandrii TaxID=2570351 RepID=UPI00200023D5|nr:GntR family transcriptional regulator [Marinobacter alexandrii]MCK2147457.1 GntR family transcriptional regulator [Marinobacter alexandrii]
MKDNEAVSLRKGTVVDSIVQTLADDIVSGQLMPGTKLDAQAMAERFGVSRTPIRETFGHLAAMGLVTHRPNRGVVVATLSPESLTDLYEAMAELEASLARLAALRMNSRQREALEHLHNESIHLVRDGTSDQYNRFNHTFHTLIFEAARSPQLQQLAETTRTRLAPFRRAQFRLNNRLSKSWEEHDAIVRAILAGDADGVARLMRAHVQTVSAMSAEFIAEHQHRPTAASVDEPVYRKADR